MNSTKCDVESCTSNSIATGISINDRNHYNEQSLCGNHLNVLGMDYLLPCFERDVSGADNNAYEDCRLYKLLFISQSDKYIVVLRSRLTENVFLIETGYVELCSLLGGVRGRNFDVPYIYEMVSLLILRMGCTLQNAVIHTYVNRDNYYKAKLRFTRSDNSTFDIDCKCADAIGVSFIVDCPIMVNTEFLGRSNVS